MLGKYLTHQKKFFKKPDQAPTSFKAAGEVQALGLAVKDLRSPAPSPGHTQRPSPQWAGLRTFGRSPFPSPPALGGAPRTVGRGGGAGPIPARWCSLPPGPQGRGSWERASLPWSHQAAHSGAVACTRPGEVGTGSGRGAGRLPRRSNWGRPQRGLQARRLCWVPPAARSGRAGLRLPCSDGTGGLSGEQAPQRLTQDGL